MKGILIFIKNPILGKAKTRLAKDIGKEKALEVYKLLLAHTRKITKSISADKLLYYALEIDKNDDWSSSVYQKFLQNPSSDLGQKMYSAFTDSFENGYERLIIIGSDCFDLSEETLNQALVQLEKKDAVIGPAFDGGYYLIGLKKNLMTSTQSILDQLFLNRDWSHKNVAQEAMKVFERFDLDFHTLPALSDIDTVKDLRGELALVAGLQN